MVDEHLVDDIIVVIPGILGSALSSHGHLVWGSAGTILKAVTRFGENLNTLTLPRHLGDDHPGDGIEPVGLLPNLHIIPGLWTANIGYSGLLEWLRVHFHVVEPDPNDPSRIPNLLQFPYDWRLSNRYNAGRLKNLVEPALDRWRSQGGRFSDAKVIFICHSMGGLVARWYLEEEQGAAERCRKLITIGTPHRGALKALEQLINGVHFLGPLGADLSPFARSLPSAYQLLPEYACIENEAGLLKTTEADLPGLDPEMVKDAMAFHSRLDQTWAPDMPPPPYDLHPIVGLQQPTVTSARIVDNMIETIDGIRDNEGEHIDWKGDGTVPRIAAVPKGVRLNSPIIRSLADQHTALPSNKALYDELEGVMTGKDVVFLGVAKHQLGVRCDPYVFKGAEARLEASVASGTAFKLMARMFDERGKEVDSVPLGPPDRFGVSHVSIPAQKPGAYLVQVGGIGSVKNMLSPVTTTLLVWEGTS